MHMLIVLEGLVMSFWLLLICVVAIADGPVGGIGFYEKNVQERVVELGLTTKEEIKKRSGTIMLALFLPVLTVVPALVYLLNGASGFMDGFVQMSLVYLIMGVFDRVFIDWYWVGRTKAWIIPGTEDLQPYIPKKTCIGKWVGTLVGFPLLAAVIAGILSLFGV